MTLSLETCIEGSHVENFIRDPGWVPREYMLEHAPSKVRLASRAIPPASDTQTKSANVRHLLAWRHSGRRTSTVVSQSGRSPKSRAAHRRAIKSICSANVDRVSGGSTAG